MEYCKVENCRYNYSHTTGRHRCGKCKQLGHGQIECNNIELINNLLQYNQDVVSIPCTITECVDNTTHTTEGHDCLYCKSRIHHLKHCPCNGTSICDTIINNNDNINNIEEAMKEYVLKEGYYVTKYAGQGCMWFIRHNSMSQDKEKKSSYEYLFMHGDCWGQYSPDTDESPRYNAFIRNYKFQDEELQYMENM